QAWRPGRFLRRDREGPRRAQDLRACADVYATRIAQRAQRTAAQVRDCDGAADGVVCFVREPRDRVTVLRPHADPGRFSDGERTHRISEMCDRCLLQTGRGLEQISRSSANPWLTSREAASAATRCRSAFVCAKGW